MSSAKWLCKIHNDDGVFVGTGFWVGESRVLTCAHVVAMAKTGEFAADVAVGAQVRLSLGDSPQVSAEVIAYRHYLPSGYHAGLSDIALLRVRDDDDPMFGIDIPLFRLLGAQDESVRIIGFSDHSPTGGTHHATLSGRDSREWYQVDGVLPVGLPAVAGMSGSPVVDVNGHLLGMLAAIDPRQGTKVSYVVPAQAIHQVCREQACFRLVSPATVEAIHAGLIELDFDSQWDTYVTATSRQRLVAFVVHGRRHCGQRALVQRILGARDYSRINLDLTATDLSVASVFRDITKSTAGRSPVEQLAVFLRNHLATHSVALIGTTGGLTDGTALRRVVFEQFWEPLTEALRVDARFAGAAAHRLILLVLDEDGQAASWKLAGVTSTKEAGWRPAVPVLLEELKAFKEEDLVKWFSSHPKLLPPALEEGGFADRLLERSNGGIPKELYERFLAKFGLESSLPQWS